MIRADRLSLALWEGDRHIAALRQALGEWDALGQPDCQRLEDDPALQRLTDQILFRFMKLQDAMGERLVVGTLERLAEPYESWPMRDRLDRLEKLGYVDVDAWLRWREVRNRLAHEYPEQADIGQASLLGAIEAARALVHSDEAWRHRVRAAGVEAS